MLGCYEPAHIVGISKIAYVLATPRCLDWRRDLPQTSTNSGPPDRPSAQDSQACSGRLPPGDGPADGTDVHYGKGDMKRNLTLLTVAVLATGLTAAGCGGADDDGGESLGKEESGAPANSLSQEESGAPANSLSQEESGAPANSLSKEEFVTQANEICKRGNAELEAAAEESLEGLPTPEDLNAFATKTLVPNVRGQIDDISALGIPEGDQATVKRFLDEAEGILDQLERDPESFSGDPFAQVNQDLAAYGLTACAPDVGG
jgi:hypothetical protein